MNLSNSLYMDTSRASLFYRISRLCFAFGFTTYAPPSLSVVLSSPGSSASSVNLNFWQSSLAPGGPSFLTTTIFPSIFLSTFAYSLYRAFDVWYYRWSCSQAIQHLARLREEEEEYERDIAELNRLGEEFHARIRGIRPRSNTPGPEGPEVSRRVLELETETETKTGDDCQCVNHQDQDDGHSQSGEEEEDSGVQLQKVMEINEEMIEKCKIIRKRGDKMQEEKKRLLERLTKLSERK